MKLIWREGSRGGALHCSASAHLRFEPLDLVLKLEPEVGVASGGGGGATALAAHAAGRTDTR